MQGVCLQCGEEEKQTAVVFHVKRVPQCNEEDLDGAYDLLGLKIKLTGRFFILTEFEQLHLKG